MDTATNDCTLFRSSKSVGNKSSFSGSQHPSNVTGKRASGINSSFVAFADGGACADRILDFGFIGRLFCG